MVDRTASKVQRYFKEAAGNHLRSVVEYHADHYEILYARDDVLDQYSEPAVERAVNESRMDSLAAPMYADIFSSNHGDLNCLVQCFENVIELNFVLDDAVGVAVALDADAIATVHVLFADARNIIDDEHEQSD